MAFVNLQRLMSLNADKGEEMAQQAIQKDGLTAGAEASVSQMQGGIGDGSEAAARVQQAQARASSVGKSNNALDSALMGGSSAMQGFRQRTNNLSTLMGKATAAQDARARSVQSNANFAQMTGDVDARAAEQKRAAQARIDAQTKGYTNASKPWNGSYDPRTPDDYVTYSNAIKNGKR